MINHTYTCDRCGEIQADASNLYRISLKVLQVGGYASSYDQAFPENEWCDKCLVASGAVKWHRKEVKAPETTPTIEIMLKELMREVAQEVVDGQ